MEQNQEKVEQYKGVRFRGIVKEEYAEMINTLMNRQHKDGTKVSWSDLKDRYGHSFLTKMALDDYCNYAIPFAQPVKMPRVWTFEDLYDTRFLKESRLWTFQFSVPDGNSRVDFFLNYVLAEIIESLTHLETMTEGEYVSTFYDLEENGLVKSRRMQGVDYREVTADYRQHRPDLFK